MNHAEIILDYISEELMDTSEIDLSKDSSLFEGKILNSLNLVSLIVFLEEKFNIKINPSEVTIENLDSINKILQFMDKKATSD